MPCGSTTTDLPPPLKWPSSDHLNPPPDQNKYFTIYFSDLIGGMSKIAFFFHNVKWLLQITLTEEKFGFDTFKPQQLDFAGIYQPFFLPNSP